MIYKNPKASLKRGKKWRLQCVSWEVGCLAFVFFFLSLTSFHPQSQSQFSVKNVTTKLRGQRVRIQCQKTSSEQASGSEGDKKITVDKKWLRQKQQYSAWVRGWVWKTFCFSDTFRSAEVHAHAQIHTSPSEVLVNHLGFFFVFFSKRQSIKVKVPKPPHRCHLEPFSLQQQYVFYWSRGRYLDCYCREIVVVGLFKRSRLQKAAQQEFWFSDWTKCKAV